MDWYTALARWVKATSRADVARRLAVNERTVRRWLHGQTKPYSYLQRLILLETVMQFGELQELRGAAREWTGWRIGADGLLYSPEGWAFSRGDLAALAFRRLNGL